MNPPRMRTAEGAFAIIKESDPDTAVTLRYIRRLIATGAVSSLAVGRKKLVIPPNRTTFEAYGYVEGKTWKTQRVR